MPTETSFIEGQLVYNVVLISGVWQSDTYIPVQILLKNFLLMLISGCARFSLLRGLSSGCGKWGLACSCGVWAYHGCELSCCRARALGLMGFSRCSSPGSWAQAPELWHLGLAAPWYVESSHIQSGIKPTSPTLAGGFFTTEPPGKPFFFQILFHCRLLQDIEYSSLCEFLLIPNC